ncbi:hypothetical protein E0K89_011575 [Aquicoccus sp. SCR17]|nr:hypothetical protein [Carideicomes alvinocaridis]
MIREGSRVAWSWGNGTGEGKVVQSFDRSVTRELSGARITRHGAPGNLALLIRQEDGDEVLKLVSEVEHLK